MLITLTGFGFLTILVTSYFIQEQKEKAQQVYLTIQLEKEKLPTKKTKSKITKPRVSTQEKEAIESLKLMGFSATEAKKYVKLAIADGDSDLVTGALNKVSI